MSTRPAGGDTAAVIPAYQAAATVGGVVEGALAEIETVLVVDDGSRDATADVARDAGAEVLSHPENRGKGTALDTGLGTLFARGFTWVVTLDADGQHLPGEIPKLLAARRDDVRLVLGTREHHFTHMSTVRKVSNHWSSRLISWAAGTSVPDVQTGFRIYHHELYTAVGGLPEKRFDAESAVFVRAGRRGLRVATVPVELGAADGRATSHYRSIVDGLRIARSVARARLERIR